jgi:hypothetical protein
LISAEDTEQEIEKQRRKVKAATYTYRSYNIKSLEFYAQRYPW